MEWICQFDLAVLFCGRSEYLFLSSSNVNYFYSRIKGITRIENQRKDNSCFRVIIFIIRIITNICFRYYWSKVKGTLPVSLIIKNYLYGS